MATDEIERKRFSVVAAGRRLAVEELRPALARAGDSPALVFLHEGLGCIASWRDVPARLSARLGLPAIVHDR